MKRALLLCLFAGACFAAEPLPPSTLPVGVKVLFSPADDIESELCRLIESAKAEVLVHQVAITNVPLVRSLLRARDKGVVTVVLLEPNPAIRNYQTPQLLRGAGIVVRLAAVNGRDNNRYLVIDGHTVVTGSYEWTATKSNCDNAIIIPTPSIADRYVEHFRAMVNTSSPVPAPSESTNNP